MRLRRKAFSSGGFAFAQTISTQITSYNLSTAATAAGWDGSSPLTATITITAAGSVIGPAGGGLAFDVPALPTGSLVTVINDGYIAGGGGLGGEGGPYTGAASPGQQGGAGLRTRAALVLKGSGVLAGGGGGGGGGAGIYITSGTGNASSMGGRGGDGTRYPSTSSNAGVSPSYVSSGDASCKGGDGGYGFRPGVNGDQGQLGTPAGSYTSVTNGTAGQGGAQGHAVDGMDFVTNESSCTFIGSAFYTVNSFIGAPTATPAAGAAFEGGYYVGGLMWGQVTQSASTIEVGAAKNVTIKIPTGAPKFYLGQTVEIRSRAAIANFMRGTVQGAANGNLTVAVASIFGGSGTFSDWSIMAQHRLVVAPKAGGETSLALALGALPADCWTLIEGYAATQAMRNAGDATQYPAAHWAAGLSIGGYTDWYVPARDELERVWRYLRPTSASNYVTADRPTSPTLSYQNNGANGDASASHGVNVNALANTGAYIAGNPSQTGVVAFRTGGAQAMDYGSAVYASSTGYDAANAWAQSYQTATPGRQVVQAKETVALIRAMRRSII